MSSQEQYAESDRPVEAWCDPSFLHVRLVDGREIITPLNWYPRLDAATPAQRNNVEIMMDGVHWPDVDEDLSIHGMLAGWRYPVAIETGERAA